MTDYEAFKQHIESAADQFRQIPKQEKIRVVSHLDADGVSACAILIHTLDKDNRPYSVSIIEQLDEDVIKKLSEEPYKVYIFSDLGAGQLSMINKHMKEKKVVILDHHTPDEGEVKEDLIYVNPHKFGIDGGIEISGSGVTYLFSSAINKENEKLAHLAIIGAMGDIQEKNGFKQLNEEILNKALKHDLIEVSKSLDVFGSQTRPIAKSLEYSNLLNGMNESEIIQFLYNIGINPRNEKGFRKMKDLSDGEMKALTAAIIMKRIDEENPEDIFTNQYILKNEEEGTAFRDVKEFATLLNSCGRLNRASVGLGACLGEEDSKKEIKKVSAEYKRALGSALSWYREKEDIIKGDNYIIINAEDKILHTIAGTLASIISKSNNCPENTFVMCLARNRNVQGTTKVSIRRSGKSNFDVRSVVREITEKVGGQAGGHMAAAGALIDTDKEQEFIKTAEEVFKKY